MGVREVLQQRVLVADGAMATALSAKGAFRKRCFDELNLSLPALVRDVHRENLDAGAQILGTNTFGANRTRLAAFGFTQKVRSINQAGVRIAREAARDQAFVAGCVGPLGSPSAAEREIFREQIDALIEAGVDLLIFETFQSIPEIREAVLAAREAAGEDLLIVAQMTVDDDGTSLGVPTEDFTRALNELPVDAIGLNCGSGPHAVFEALQKMARFTEKPLSVMPSAGLPNLTCSPEYLAGYTQRLVEAGARIVGGCCGTTAQHIKKIRDAVDRLEIQPLPRAVEIPPAAPNPIAEVPPAYKSKLGAQLAAGQFVTMMEILPPRGIDVSQEIEIARACQAAGINFVVVPDVSGRLSALTTCQLIQWHTGMEAIWKYSARGRGILDMQSDLLAAQATLVKNLIHQTGQPIGSPAGLLIGVAATPESLDTAGADYVVTPPVFDVESLELFAKGIPVIASIRPLTSLLDAEYLVNERRVPIPAAYMERMRRAGTDDAARAEGVAIASEIVQLVRPLVAGVQWSGPYQMAIDVAKAFTN